MRREAEIARDVAANAAVVAARLQGKVASRDKGGRRGPVTDADLAVEKMVLERLRAAFPDDGFLGEESAERPESANRLWCVDPIDGTREYIDGLPEYAVQIGLLADGEPVSGAFALPATGEVYWGWRGGGAWRGERAVRLPEVASPGDATLITSRSHREGTEAAAGRIAPAGRIAAGSVGYKVGRLLAGDAHIYLHAGRGAHWWDTVGPAAVFLAAGGRVSDGRGAPLDFRGELEHRTGLLFTLPGLFERVVAAIR